MENISATQLKNCPFEIQAYRFNSQLCKIKINNMVMLNQHITFKEPAM